MKHLLTLLFIFPFVVLSSAAQNTTIGDDLSTASQVSQTPVSKNNGLQFYITSPTTCIVIENKEQFVSDDVIIPENAWIDGKSYTVTGIAREAFQYCSALTSLEIPASVKSIRDYAFLRCDALTRINIPRGVEKFETFTFCNTGGLTCIDVDEANEHFCSVDGVLYDKKKTTIIRYPERKAGDSFQICSSVTTIGDMAFANCSSLTSIRLSKRVTTIGNGAFLECSSLTDVKIPKGVTAIGVMAFSNCQALTRIRLPKSITTISHKAFNDCKSLTRIDCYAKTPPSINGDGPDIPSGVTIHVPRHSKKAYLKAEFWKDCRIKADL